MAIDLNKLSPEERKAVEARRAYQKEYRKKNKERIKQNNLAFYLRAAAKAQELNVNDNGAVT